MPDVVVRVSGPADDQQKAIESLVDVLLRAGFDAEGQWLSDRRPGRQQPWAMGQIEVIGIVVSTQLTAGFLGAVGGDAWTAVKTSPLGQLSLGWARDRHRKRERYAARTRVTTDLTIYNEDRTRILFHWISNQTDEEQQAETSDGS